MLKVVANVGSDTFSFDCDSDGSSDTFIDAFRAWVGAAGGALAPITSAEERTAAAKLKEEADRLKAAGTAIDSIGR